ncbi:MAG: hypothetical protein E7378_04600 [Clostridiales bacterium]|nr:hypothetical protein [Clostridiales bacterium]
MDIKQIVEKLSEIAVVKQNSAKEYEIITAAKINGKTPIRIYLTTNGDVCNLSDKKNTLKYMNNIYELASTDVKNCISAVVRLYGFAVKAGELVATLKDAAYAAEIFYNFIICVGQLANMLVFFDQPV